MSDRQYEVVISRKRRLHDIYDLYDFDVISKYDPDSIFEYLDKSNRRDRNNILLDNARKHLSAIGWKFWSKVKKGNDEWRYKSPRGKTYYSLNTACEAISRGVESIGRDGSEGNVGGFTGSKKRKKNKRKKNRVIECVISDESDDDDEVLRRRRDGFRGNVDDQRTRRVDSKTEILNDSICTICQYGGDLILCDRCPSSFHGNCLNLEGFPEGEWFCPTCCCAVCGISHVDDDLLRCYQCERRYHAHCKKGRETDHPGKKWFCCLTCEKMQWGLEMLLGKRILVGQDGLSWTLIKPMQYDAEDQEHCDMGSVAENHSKLRVALKVMHECFEPVKDLRTNRDLVEDVVFCRGSKLDRLNFTGFYTVLLERNDEMIATALLRIYGEKVAEVPLIGTRVQYRRLGMCRVLMKEIEKTLLNLGVKKLVLPAAPSVVNTWTNSFGFSIIEESDRRQYLGYTFLDFQDTVMCQKLLRKLPMSRLHLSRDMSSVHRQPRKNVEGRGTVVYKEANSSMPEVFNEDQRQGSDEGGQVLDAPSATGFMDQRRVERDKNSVKFYIRKQDMKPRKALVSQTNYSRLERVGVRCR